MNDYSNVFIRSKQVEQTTDLIQSKFNIYTNYINTLHTSKTSQVYLRLLQKQDYIKNFSDYQNNDRSFALKAEKKGLNFLFLNNLKTKYLMSDMFFNKKQNLLSKIADKQFFLLNPKLICSYIANQLNRLTTLKRLSFKSNLNSGILKFCYQLLNRYQNSIIGLKIICAGK